MVTENLLAALVATYRTLRNTDVYRHISTMLRLSQTADGAQRGGGAQPGVITGPTNQTSRNRTTKGKTTTMSDSNKVTALVKFEHNYPVLSEGGTEGLEMVNANLGGDPITWQDLPRLKVPAGGGHSFDIPTPGGDFESVQGFSGVVLYTGRCRGYWPEPLGAQAVPPSCTSRDGMEGEGEPGGDCLVCQYNQFGSAPPDPVTGKERRGKACKEQRVFFILREGDGEFMPYILLAPPSSLKSCRKYLMGLARDMRIPAIRDRRVTRVVTTFSLVVEPVGGYDVAIVKPRLANTLDRPHQEAVHSFLLGFTPTFADFMSSTDARQATIDITPEDLG